MHFEAYDEAAEATIRVFMMFQEYCHRHASLRAKECWEMRGSAARCSVQTSSDVLLRANADARRGAATTMSQAYP